MQSFRKNLLFTLIFCCLATFCTGQIRSLSGKEIPAAAMDSFLKKEMAVGRIPGLSIALINKGKVVYSREMGLADIKNKKKVDDKTLFQAASLTKSIFAYFVMKHVEKGLLALDTPLYKYMPYPDIAYDEQYKLITARMVLSHTTGLPNWRDDGKIPDSLLTKVKKGTLYLKFRPGTRVSYSGEGFQYLARTIAHLLNTDLSGLGEIMNKEVCASLGMANSTLIKNDYVDRYQAEGHLPNDDGTVWQGHETFDELNAAASLLTNAPEFAKFMMALMNKKGLKEQSINEMFKDQAYDDPPSHRTAMGLGVFISHTSVGDRISHNGNNGQFTADYVLYPDKKNGFVFFINNNMETHLMQHLEYFFKHGEEYPVKDADIPIDVNSYVGEYKSSDRTTSNFVFFAEKGRLYLYLTKNPNRKLELHPAAKDDFFLTEIVAKLLFTRDARGKVIGFELEQESTLEEKFKKIN